MKDWYIQLVKCTLDCLPVISSSYQDDFLPACTSSWDISVCVRRGLGDSYFSFFCIFSVTNGKQEVSTHFSTLGYMYWFSTCRCNNLKITKGHCFSQNIVNIYKICLEIKSFSTLKTFGVNNFLHTKHLVLAIFLHTCCLAYNKFILF